MTIPKRLQEKRDEFAVQISKVDAEPEYYKRYPEIWDLVYDVEYESRYSRAMGLSYKEGFSAACALLLPEVEKLKSTIDCAAKYLELCGYNDVDQSEPELQMLQSFYKAMQSLEEFLGEKSEGDNET